MEVYPTVTNTSRSMWNILVIDDDEDDLVLVKEMLREAKGRKVAVHWATSFEAGREALHSPDYNAVLVDYDLGSHTGIELIREANAQGVAAPLILFTGRGSYEVDVEAMEAGATLYLTKGEVNPLLLERGIRYAIDLKQKETELRHSKERLEQELAERRRAEEQLAFQASLLDNIHDAIIANEVEQRITAWNKAAEKLYGYTAQEALGEIHGDLLRSEMSYEQRASLLQQLQENDEYTLEVVQYTKNGRRLIVEGRTIPRRDRDGQITGYVTANRDITERKQAEAEREQLLLENRVRADQLETVVQALPVGVWVTDAGGRILMKNEQADHIWVGDAPLSASIDGYREYPSWDAVTGRQIEREEYPLAVTLRTGLPVAPVEHDIRRIDGSQGTVLVSARPIKNEEGRVTGAVAINVDITERKKMEIILQQREALLEAFFANSPSVLNIVDEELRYVKTGNLTPSFFGLDRHSIVGKAIKDLDTEFVEKIGPVMKRVIDTGQPEKREVQFPVFGREGEKTNWQASFFPIPLPEGKTGVGIIGVEITAQKKAEEALRESEQRYTALFHAKTNGIAHCRVITDEQGQPIDYEILEVNEAYEEITGIKRADIEGYRAREVFPGIENFSYDYIGNYGRVGLEGGELNFETFFETTKQWLSIYIYSPKPGEFTAIFSDISQRKQAEGLLKESTEALQVALAQAEKGRMLLEALMEHVPEGIAITGGPPDFPLEHISRYGLELTRNPNNPDLLGKPAGEHQKDWRIFLADGETLPSKEQMPLYRASHFGEIVRNEEMVIRLQSGERITVLVNAAPIRDDQGQIKGAINSWRDITERKQAEKALSEREEMLQLALSAGNAGAWSWDLTTNTVQWSPEYDRIFGFEPGTIEPTVEAGFSRIHPEDYLRIEVVTQDAIAQGKKIDEVHRVIWPDGSVHWVRGLSQAFYDPQGKPERLAGIALDVTAEKQEEEMLAKYAEQLARSNQELAQFAFIASHDLQEPLRKIKQFGNMLQQKLKGKLDEDTQDSFERMLLAVDRMQKMIQDLLELSRVNTQTNPLVDVDLSRVTAEVVSDLDALIHRTKGQVIIDPLPVIQADPIQMHRVLQNIIGNALKFHKPDTPPVVKVSSEMLNEGNTAGQKVLIRVEDNGIGFEEAQFAQILQPFRRLHGHSEYEGTGFGLTIVKKIIERHQGDITAKSHPGQGSTFIITLPIKQTG